ncbi:MAG: hypothetical protein CMF51_03300 [Legionellales bacterium]|nr:hypothetical protein [Legionellales bacterium]
MRLSHLNYTTTAVPSNQKSLLGSELLDSRLKETIASIQAEDLYRSDMIEQYTRNASETHAQLSASVRNEAGSSFRYGQRPKGEDPWLEADEAAQESIETTRKAYEQKTETPECHPQAERQSQYAVQITGASIQVHDVSTADLITQMNQFHRLFNVLMDTFKDRLGQQGLDLNGLKLTSPQMRLFPSLLMHLKHLNVDQIESTLFQANSNVVKKNLTNEFEHLLSAFVGLSPSPARRFKQLELLMEFAKLLSMQETPDTLEAVSIASYTYTQMLGAQNNITKWILRMENPDEFAFMKHYSELWLRSNQLICSHTHQGITPIVSTRLNIPSKINEADTPIPPCSEDRFVKPSRTTAAAA